MLFQPLLRALPEWIQPVVISYPHDRFLTYDQLLPQVIASLPPTDPFILFGESFSGPLAVMAAATRPLNLCGLILCATFVTSPMGLISPILRLLARPLLFRSFPAAQQAKALLGRYSNPELQKLFAEVHAKVPAHIIAARLRLVLQVDVRDQLQRCDVHTLYLAAKHDRIVPRCNYRLLQRLLPQLQLVILNAPHGIPQSRPEDTAEAIAKFISLARTSR